MAYNKAGKLSINAIISGSAAIEAVRGPGTWGANWLFASGGATNDIKVLADTVKYLSTSGAYATDAELSALSGYVAGGPFPSGRFTKLVAGSGNFDQITAASGNYTTTLTTATFTATSGNPTFGTMTAATIQPSLAITPTRVGTTLGTPALPIASGDFTKITVATEVVSAVSGTAIIGSKYNPIRASGLYMVAANNNTVWALSIQADGSVSGVLA